MELYFLVLLVAIMVFALTSGFPVAFSLPGAAILTTIADICGTQPPWIQLPRRLIFPVAYAAEAWAWLTDGPEPQATVDGLKMAKKKMYFDCSRARDELGYRPRPSREALADAVSWFKQIE